MLNQKDLITQNIKILSTKNVSSIPDNDGDDDYIFGPLTCEGGGVFKKGVAIGIQEKMVGGLLIYDNENFYGFSEKYGLSLLSSHPEYIELSLPENYFAEERNKIHPVGNNDFKDLKETIKESDLKKTLNIDILIKEASNFFIIIPDLYEKSKFQLIFDINFIYDINSIISNISLVFINQSSKIINFVIKNDNCFYESGFPKNDDCKIDGNNIFKINLEVITPNNFLLSKNIYTK